jgi:multidrug/hemolysin transport system permease protein
VKTLRALVERNCKLFFRDKGIFFTSLITPLILLVLYVSFLGNVYTDSLRSVIPDEFTVSEKAISGFAGASLISSILSVCCVTVAFCSNMLMVQDRANGTVKDLTISPVKPSVMSLGYYLSTLISTLTVCLSAMVICLVYIAFAGWFLSVADVLLLALDVVLLCLFGVALSSIINFFLSSQGQISAVGTIVSSGYGFICGAYMPISSFSPILQKVISFLPGTYGTALVRNHAMRGVFEEMGKSGLPAEMLSEIRDGFDCNLYFFGTRVEQAVMYAVLLITVALLIGAYIGLNILRSKKIK